MLKMKFRKNRVDVEKRKATVNRLTKAHKKGRAFLTAEGVALLKKWS